MPNNNDILLLFQLLSVSDDDIADETGAQSISELDVSNISSTGEAISLRKIFGLNHHVLTYTLFLCCFMTNYCIPIFQI